MQQLINFLHNEYVERFLDSLLILLTVSIITFLFVRIDLSVQSIDIGQIIVSIFILICFCVQRHLKQSLKYIGLFAGILLIIMYPYIFESYSDAGIWGYIIFPCIYASIICLYLIRSYTCKNKYLLKLLGLILVCTCIWQISSTEFTTITLEKPFVIKAGDPLADLRLNPAIYPEVLEQEKIRLGLDKPLYKQYLLWLENIILKQDFGITQQGEQVIHAVKAPLLNTILLNFIVITLTWIIAIPLGVLAATNYNKLTDSIILNISSLSLTVPSFLLAIFILSMAFRFSFGEVGGLTSINFDDLSLIDKFLDILNHLILPVITMVFVSIGMLIRQMRGNLLDVLNEDYIKACKARGLSNFIILWKHAVPNAINPLVSLLGFEFASLISGAALTEIILGYPGIGALTLEAARKMDINLIMFMLLLGSMMLLIGNLLADLLLKYIDPRVAKVSSVRI